MLDQAYEESKKVIEACFSKGGLFASAGKSGYNAVWSRDSMITSLGASFLKESKFKEKFKTSLITLGENQAKSGQIPNCVDKFSERKSHVDFQSIDSTLWYLIGHYVYKERYGDKSLFKKYKSNIENAFKWLSSQDISEIGMLAQLPTTDWQDAFPHKYGHTINTQSLYYKALLLRDDKKSAEKLKKIVNEDPDKMLWNKEFYYAYRWKNHNSYKEAGEFFDSLGNLLAIVFGLADKEKAKKIIGYIQKNKLNEPCPIRAIYPSIKKGDQDWQDYYLDCDAGQPNSYLNGGIWTFIGSFYVLALIKLGRFNEAEKELEKIAESNLKNNFPEWIHPLTKKSYGTMQAWDAGAYILAYESLKQKKVLI